MSAAALQPFTLSPPTHSYLLTQVTLSFRPSPPAAAARRLPSLGALPRPLPLPPVSPPLTDAAQRVALFCLEPDMHVHMHASTHLLTLTNLGVTGRILHQPRDLTSTDSHSPACRASRAFRPPEGCRSAAAKRCRSGRGRRRWGGCGGSRWLHARASRRRCGAGALLSSRGVRRKRRPPPSRHRAAARSPRFAPLAGPSRGCVRAVVRGAP